MRNVTTELELLQSSADVSPHLFEDWFDPIEEQLRKQVRGFIEEMIRGELDEVLSRPRYGRQHAKRGDDRVAAGVAGHRHGSRTRTLTGTFGKTQITVPRARLTTADGKTTEWKSKALRAYQRRTRAADSLIASTYLSGTNTRRVRRALTAVFGGAVGKDTVSRIWRKVKTDWEAWSARDLSAEPIVRLILDGTAVKVRLDRKATTILLLVVIGVRADGQKVLLAVKNMGSESAEAWRSVLDDLIKRGLRRPELLIIDGGSGLESALAAVWGEVPVQRCTVHKHRNLLAHAPERLHEEISADYNDMIYAESCAQIEARRKAFLRKWRLKHRAVADSLRKRAIGSSPSRACRRANGRARAPPTPSSGCTKSSSEGSRRKRCCRRQTRRLCCSGLCSPQGRSSCAKSMAGTRLLPSQVISRLTSQLDQISSKCRRCAAKNFNRLPDGT
jgi:transposase-like protein